MALEAPPQKITLRDAEGRERKVSMLIPDQTPIGSGTRSKVYRVFVQKEGDLNPADAPAGGEYMAMKVYTTAQPLEHAKSTMEGHGILSRNLPESEKHRIANVYTDEEGRVFLPLLNTDSRVVSMGNNDSQDRRELKEKKLESIPNFNAILGQLLDAVEEMGSRGIPMGPDVYLLKVHRETNALDYAYADMESMHAKPGQSPEQVVLNNLYWAAGAFNHFLHECVKDPALYLARVRQEVASRMDTYEGIADARGMKKEVDAFEWPVLNWKQAATSNTSWFMASLWRFVKGSFNS